MYYMGIDCGTQGTKAVVFNSDTGMVIGKGYARHNIIADDTGRREQEAQWWIDAMVQAVRGAVKNAGIKGADIKALAVSGQQHGLVVLDEQGRTLRPVKLWNDTSTASQNAALVRESGGLGGVWKILGSTLAVGYTASKVRYIVEKEPNLYRKVRHVLLPHDYLNFYLCGNYVTDGSEASGTGYYDVKNRRYSAEMIHRIDPSGILEKAVPPVYSWKVPAGTLRKEATEALGLSPATLVGCGGGDNTMGVLGTGAITEGACSMGLGTSGTIAVLSPFMGTGIDEAIQIYEVLDDKWLITTCSLNATSATTVVQELFGLSVEELDAAIMKASPGSGGVRVIPYFDGERVPAIPSAQALFQNLTSLNCKKENIIRATVESVSLNLRWGLDKITRSFPAPQKLVVTGGGANSAPWRQIVGDVFDMTVHCLQSDEGGALGAAIQALYLHQIQTGNKLTLQELCDTYILYDPGKETHPIRKNVELYQDLLGSYKGEVKKEWGIDT
ncbi:MAG: xylulokinase [Spirochaetaceae bacterium]|jgi:xylulokinase|nr:xylulokinase [Spirochaetaceae bacterium]